MQTFTADIVNKLAKKETPFYYYNLDVLHENCKRITTESAKFNFEVHYALKANVNTKILNIIQSYGLGADCVSGQEILTAIQHGFKPQQVVFAGVGKSDKEITIALTNNIACFNCESIQEIEIINQLAKKNNTTARIALRINPNVSAKTHHYITTGLEENKFGINEWELPEVLATLNKSTNIILVGIHFHIGSQITDLSVFGNLCSRVNEFQHFFTRHGIKLEHLNVGGGLGIDYYHPDTQALTNFEAYFEIFNRFLEREPNQKVHFEIGRSLVAQCGNLITKTLYIKKGIKTNFV
ncbi:MAG: diaminopimelate decarboxylase, partial [Bacteroidia bacterium]|nr:diaminopimelate decarboxylase [Bacteroidia bacterium]